ncbi:hypothetical protein C8Q74DRAFT_1222453 [Fomes fomentarius]|nr:hypothetical protein C8Q74DRAFT_1222453 [Fomes fomentarius]
MSRRRGIGCALGFSSSADTRNQINMMKRVVVGRNLEARHPTALCYKLMISSTAGRFSAGATSAVPPRAVLSPIRVAPGTEVEAVLLAVRRDGGRSNATKQRMHRRLGHRTVCAAIGVPYATCNDRSSVQEQLPTLTLILHRCLTNRRTRATDDGYLSDLVHACTRHPTKTQATRPQYNKAPCAAVIISMAEKASRGMNGFKLLATTASWQYERFHTRNTVPDRPRWHRSHSTDQRALSAGLQTPSEKRTPESSVWDNQRQIMAVGDTHSPLIFDPVSTLQPFCAGSAANILKNTVKTTKICTGTLLESQIYVHRDCLSLWFLQKTEWNWELWDAFLRLQCIIRLDYYERQGEKRREGLTSDLMRICSDVDRKRMSQKRGEDHGLRVKAEHEESESGRSTADGQQPGHCRQRYVGNVRVRVRCMWAIALESESLEMTIYSINGSACKSTHRPRLPWVDLTLFSSNKAPSPVRPVNVYYHYKYQDGTIGIPGSLPAFCVLRFNLSANVSDAFGHSRTHTLAALGQRLARMENGKLALPLWSHWHFGGPDGSRITSTSWSPRSLRLHERPTPHPQSARICALRTHYHRHRSFANASGRAGMIWRMARVPAIARALSVRPSREYATKNQLCSRKNQLHMSSYEYN